MQNKNLEILLNNFRNNYQDHKIAISSADGFVFVKVSNIIYLESEGAYTFFYLRHNEKIVTSKILKNKKNFWLTTNSFTYIKHTL